MVVGDNKSSIFDDLTPNKVTLPSLPAKYIQTDFVDPENHDDSTLQNQHVQATSHLPFAISDVYRMKIKSVINLVVDEDDAKTVIELILDGSDIKNNILPGDTVGILPENRDEEVNLILNALDLADKGDAVIKIGICPQNTKKTVKVPPYIPLSSTPRLILKQCLNIHAAPKKLFLRALVECTSDENEKNLLKILCSKEGSNSYSKLLNEGNLTFIKILQMCSSCRPNFGLLLEHLPRLLPRPYSIANSPLDSNNEIKIVFSVLKDNPGVTTDFLQKLSERFLNKQTNTEKVHVNCYLREHNRFRYTEDDIIKDVIMISVGCGISPFLGFMEYKDKFFKNTKYSKLSNMWLFSGFRYRNCSLYADEIKDYLRRGILTEYFESYSREQNYKYKYIQDCIVDNAKRFVEIIFKNDALIYVCADGANISKDIQQSIQKAIETALDCSFEEAKEIFIQLQTDGKYREDIWT